MVVPGYSPRPRPAGRIARQVEDFTAGGSGPTIDYDCRPHTGRELRCRGVPIGRCDPITVGPWSVREKVGNVSWLVRSFAAGAGFGSGRIDAECGLGVCPAAARGHAAAGGRGTGRAARDAT